MKNKHRLWWLASVPVIALVWAMKSAASWRPQVVGIQKNASYIYCSPDGKLFIVGDNSSNEYIWDAEKQQLLWNNNRISNTFSSDSRVLGVVQEQGVTRENAPSIYKVEVELRDARSGKIQRVLKDPIRRATDEGDSTLGYTFARDDHEFRLATQHALRIWNTQTGRLTRCVPWKFKAPFGNQPVSEVQFISEQMVLVSLATQRWCDARTGIEIERPQVTKDYIDGMIGSQIFYSETEDDGAKFIDANKGKQLWKTAHGEALVWILPDNKEVYCRSKNGIVRRNSLTGKLLAHLNGPPSHFISSPDGNWLYEARGGKIWKWRAR